MFEVTVHKTAEYDRKRIRALLEAPVATACRDYGIRRSDTVLLKPNLLGGYAPEKGVTTHPVIVAAVAGLLADAGVSLQLGDSPGVRAKLGEILEKTGLSGVVAEFGIEVIEFEKTGVRAFTAPGGRVYHPTAAVFEADAVINLAKMKTHVLTLYTGAVKNLFGCIPGFAKQDLHRESPDPESFSAHLRDIYRIIEPRVALHVMDGIIGMDRLGPGAGRAQRFGLLFAAKNGVALDFSASAAYGFDPASLHHLHDLDVSPVEVDPGPGGKFEDFRLRDVDIRDLLLYHRVAANIPTFLKKLYKRTIWTRPVVKTSGCTACGVCMEACPVSTIDLVAGRAFIDQNGCIKCLCCYELCPEGTIAFEHSAVKRCGKKAKQVLSKIRH